MDEEQARLILGKAIEPDGSMYNVSTYIAWDLDQKTVCLDGYFSAEKLKALAWWMENKGLS